jgi:hypothetical protein
MASVQGWGRLTWGSGAWNEYAPVEATGEGLTSSTEDVTVVTDQVISVSLDELTSTAGNVVATGIANATPGGNELEWKPIGTYVVQSDFIFPITGTDATSYEGDVTTTVEIRAGWNRSKDITTGAAIGWGDQQWGASGGSYAVSLDELTATSGTGSTITTDQIITISVPSPYELESSIGTYSITGDAGITIVAASEPELDATTGSVSIAISPTVEPAGQVATSAVGDVLTSIFVTGVSATASEGDATQETSYMAPSEEATTSVGTVNIQTDVTFTLTGVSATSSTGTLGGIFWSQVDDSNSSLTWKEVHKAA